MSAYTARSCFLRCRPGLEKFSERIRRIFGGLVGHFQTVPMDTVRGAAPSRSRYDQDHYGIGNHIHYASCSTSPAVRFLVMTSFRLMSRYRSHRRDSVKFTRLAGCRFRLFPIIVGMSEPSNRHMSIARNSSGSLAVRFMTIGTSEPFVESSIHVD